MFYVVLIIIVYVLWVKLTIKAGKNSMAKSIAKLKESTEGFKEMKRQNKEMNELIKEKRRKKKEEKKNV